MNLKSAELTIVPGNSVEFVPATSSSWAELEPGILAIERAAFPASIRDSPEDLRDLADSPSAIFLTARVTEPRKIVGYLAADRLEKFSRVPGVRDDPHFGKADTMYIESVAVRAGWRDRGLGVALQKECLRRAERAGFKRVTAHLEHGAPARMGLNGEPSRSFHSWYGTGRTFDYVIFPLRPRG